MPLHHETVHPIQDVERPVRPQREQVVRRNALRLARLADHEQLRQDRHRLEVDAEGPQHLEHGEVMVDEEGEEEGGYHEELDAEGVVVVVVGRAETEVD